MSLNRVVLQARIPFDIELKNADQEGKEYLGMSVSVKRNYKPEGEQYYPEDLLFCKAFKGKAAFIAKYFKKGDDIIIEGELRRDDDYEKDGEAVKGQMYISITDAYFAGGKRSGDDSPSDEAPAKPAAKKTTSAPAKTGASKPSTPGLNPLAGGKKKGPF